MASPGSIPKIIIRASVKYPTLHYITNPSASQILFNKFEIAEAAFSIVMFADAVNKYVTENAPWTLAKEEKMLECGQVIYNVLEAMRHIAIMLYPYCPNIAQDIISQLNTTSTFKYDELTWGGIKAEKITEKEKIKPVFLRLDSEFATDKKKG